ncbi:hypothetical protein BVX94_01380 [bacterium B17]|nr:hypothetical protein BVX94_01380 [bacterium B17]
MSCKCICKVIVFGMVFATVICGGISAAAQEAEMGISAGSAYVFRGVTEVDDIVLQPYIETRLAAFGFKVWGNSNLEEWDEIDDQGVFSDMDISFFFGNKDDILDYQLGYTEYVHSAGVSPETREIYAYAAWFATQHLKPLAALYYDIAQYDDFYGNLGLSYVSFLGNDMEITASGILGFIGSDMSLGSDGGLNEYVLAADLLYHVNDYTKLSVKLGYTSTLDDDVLPEQPVDFFFSAGLSRVML